MKEKIALVTGALYFYVLLKNYHFTSNASSNSFKTD
jgi:hypothetical protein